MTTTKTQHADIDWDSVEGTNQEFQDVYPRIQWHHGKKQFARVGGLVHTGGLFVPADQFPNFEAEGWQPDSFTTSKNEEIKGFYSTSGHLAIIRVKTWWGESDDHKKYSTTHMLCAIRGIDALFSLQVSGVSKGMPMNQAFTQHRNQIVAVANRSRPQNAPAIEPFGLWFVVKPDEHESIASAKDASKASEVTRPILDAPEQVDVDYVRSLYVGKDNYLRFAGYYKETEAWQNQIPKQATEDHAPEFAGPTRVTDATLSQILQLITMKGLEERDLVLSHTQGETDRAEQLTEKEAKDLIETLKSI